MDEQIQNFLNIIRGAIHCENAREPVSLNQPVDWAYLTDIAKKQNLLALFHEIAHLDKGYKEYSNYQENMHLAMMIVMQQIQRTQLFLETYQLLLQEEITPIVMKGIVCRQLYGTYAEHRPSGDEDILVRKEDYFKVKTILEQNGFVCTNPSVTEAQLCKLQDVAFYDKQSGFVLEVHANAIGYNNQMREKMGASFQDVFEHTQEVEINGVKFTIMNHTKHYLYLVLHAFKHFALNGVGLRQVIDILLYQEAYEEQIDWEEISRVLRANHALKYLGDMQFIGVNYLGCQFKKLFPVCNPQVVLRDMVETGVFGEHERADQVSMSLVLSTSDYEDKGIFKWIRAGFPTKNQMLDVAPYLEDKPWMLPVEWIKRWGRFLKRVKEYEGNLLLESAKKSEKRKKMLRMYKQ